jgi:hypothetical protein
MTLRTKITIGVSLLVLTIIILPVLLTNYLLNQESQPEPIILEEPEIVDFQDFSSEPFPVEEGYTFDLINTWDLQTHEPERAVDRYRFERAGSQNAVFTLSFYEDHGSFEEVIDARYGDAFTSGQEEIEVNGMDAVIVTSVFLDQGDTSDVIVQVGENSFVSLYGIHQPEGESSTRITSEINSMQMSFKAQE